MKLSETKKSIKEKINVIEKLDIKKLSISKDSRYAWNQLGSVEIKRFVKLVIGLIKKINKFPTILDGLSFAYCNDLESLLSSFITDFDKVKHLNDSQITTHDHGALDQLSKIDKFIRSSGIHNEISLTPNLSATTAKVEEANAQLAQFNVDDFSNAISLVDELTQKRASLESKVIQDSLGTFLMRAKEHKIHRVEKFISMKFSGHWWWLVLAILMGIFVAYIVFSFISISNISDNIDVGTAILRISSLIVPTYFMIFFVNQFTYHKKMYESYSFKNTSLHVMSELMETNKGRSDDILGKGLDILFSEPKVQDSKKYDNQLVAELLSMLKGQISK